MAQSGRSRPTNLALLILLPGAIMTGLLANGIGVDWFLDPATIHGVVSLAIVLLAPWKSVVVRRGMARRRRSRWTSVAFLVLVGIVILSGLAHSSGFTGRLGPLALMQVHVGAAVGALVLLLLHWRSHPVRPRPTDFDRRAWLRVGTLAAGAGAVWLVWEGLMNVARWAGADRRFTGSHAEGSFRPHRMPVTSWLDDRPPEIDRTTWRLDIDGRLLTLDDLTAFPRDDLVAVLDCTSGWYSEQNWQGVRLDHLVAAAAGRSFEVRSSTGYARRFPSSDLGRTWLATHVGAEPLSVDHGFPARIVAPDRRGFWWVKWVDQITTSDRPWWVQSPFPTT